MSESQPGAAQELLDDGAGAGPPPGVTPGPDDSAGQGGPSKNLWRVVSLVAGLALLIAVFGFAFPQLASYGKVLDTLKTMTTTGVAVVAVATLVNLVANWFLITTALPGLTMRRAAATNLASTAVANTVPGGGAIAMGVSWRMLTGWGVTSRAFGVYAIATGVWSLMAKFATPVVALVILLFSNDLPHGSKQSVVIWIMSGVGLGICLPLGILVRSALRDERGAEAADRWLGRLAGRVFRLIKRPAPAVIAGMMGRLRHEAGDLIKARGRRLTFAIIASDLGWWVVLQSCLWACGVTQAEVSWQRCFAAFAVARAISSVPITPGGLGVVDFGLSAFLMYGLDASATAGVLAAILLTRAATFLLPIPLGAVTYLGWTTTGRRRQAA